MNRMFRTILFGVVLLTAVIGVEAGSFYVVVGSFSEEAGARNFSAAIDAVFPGASFRLDPERKQYHVHVMETNMLREAETFRDVLRTKKGFWNAWIYADLRSGEPAAYASASASGDYLKMELHTGGAVLLSSTDNSYLSISKAKTETGSAKGLPGDALSLAFSFVAQTTTARDVPAMVTLVNNSGDVISSFKSRERVVVSPGKGNRQLIFVCKAPGYGAETKVVDMANPDGLHQDSTGVWEVRFQLTRLTVDAVQLRFHQVFERDAAIFSPEGAAKLDALISMLEANPSWRMTINSHCNPGDKRDITIPGRENDFFDLTAAVRRTGSDKSLTAEQANTLRDYMISRGIDSKRIGVMGWGSLNLLVRPDAANACLNERVDVELKGE